MKIDNKKILLMIAAAMFISACDNGAQQGSVAPVKKSAAVEKKVEAVVSKPAEGNISEPALRNPFQSYILVKRTDKDKTSVVKGPLECCEIATFKLVASLVTGDKPYALISGADNKRYIVRIGDKIGVNGGKIVVINTEGITIREVSRDLDGNIVNTNDVKLSASEQSETPAGPGASKNTRR